MASPLPLDHEARAEQKAGIERIAASENLEVLGPGGARRRGEF